MPLRQPQLQVPAGVLQQLPRGVRLGERGLGELPGRDHPHGQRRTAPQPDVSQRLHGAPDVQEGPGRRRHLRGLPHGGRQRGQQLQHRLRLRHDQRLQGQGGRLVLHAAGAPAQGRRGGGEARRRHAGDEHLRQGYGCRAHFQRRGPLQLRRLPGEQVRL